LTDWNWRFGKTPEFSNCLETRFDWGSVTVHLDFKQGSFQDIKIYSDNLIPNMIDKLTLNLRDQFQKLTHDSNYRWNISDGKGNHQMSTSIGIACEKTKLEVPEAVAQIDQFQNWLRTVI